MVYSKVRFVDGSAVDQGGPRREFFRLLAHEISKTYFSGDGAKYFVNNISAIQVRSTIIAYYNCSDFFFLCVCVCCVCMCV